MSDTEIPEGFSPFPLDNSFNDVFAPVYITFDDKSPRIALRVKKHHLNPIGICHGAVYMALFDIAFSATVCHQMGKYTGTPTININVDYMSASKEGELLFVDAKCLKLANTAGFAQGTIHNEQGEIKASGSGVFKLPKDIASAEGVTVEELKQMRNS